jgi:O-antigen ligase
VEKLAWLLLCALVFTLPFEKSLSATRWIGIALVLAWLFKRPKRPPTVVLLLGAVFAGWSAATYLWSIDPAATLSRAVTYAGLVAVTYVTWDLSRTVERYRWLLRLYLGGAAVAAALTFWRFGAGLQTYYRRYAPPGFDPNDFAMTAALAIAFGLYLALHERPWVYRGLLAVICVAVLLTGSRTGLAATAVGMTFVLWTWRRSNWVQQATPLMLAALVAAAGLTLAPKPTRQRLTATASEAVRGTINDRTTIWRAGLKVLGDRPVAGFGAGAYPDAVRPLIGVPARAGHENVAHNSFLSVLVETGAVGLLLYGAMLAAACVFVWVLPPPERALWATTLAVWATGSAFLTWEHRKPGWLILALIMCAWARAFEDGRRVPE